MIKDPHRYDDIIHLPHHQSGTRPHMSLSDRAAQFSPFAALTGYGNAVQETARLTETKVELDENAKACLDERLRILQEHLQERPFVTFAYFVPDVLKEGGSYTTSAGYVKKIDLLHRKFILFADNGISDGTEISIDEISAIEGDIFNKLI